MLYYNKIFINKKINYIYFSRTRLLSPHRPSGISQLPGPRSFEYFSSSKLDLKNGPRSFEYFSSSFRIDDTLLIADT